MSGRFNMKQSSGTRQLGNSSSTNSFHNQNPGPIGPRGATIKNTQCIISSSGLNGPQGQREEYPRVRKAGTINLRSKKNLHHHENENRGERLRSNTHRNGPSQGEMSITRAQAHESPLINRDIQMSASPKKMGIRDSHPSKYLSRDLTTEIQR